jgi:hydroxymethylglutaryl-CoA synthase
VSGIVSYGSYVPRYRLAREKISVPPAVGVSAQMRGARAVAGADEDTTTLAIEAARRALHEPADRTVLDVVCFATAQPAYREKNNATLIHAVLGLPRTIPAFDCAGSYRAAAATLQMALHGGGRTLLVTADIRTSKPGGADERDGGDAAAALLVTSGDEPVIAEYLGGSSLTEEFLDRWRAPDETVARTWEERFGQEVYDQLGVQALSAAAAQAGLTRQDIKHLVVASPNTRALKSLPKSAGLSAAAGDDRIASVGNTGCAHASLLLADVLDRAKPGEVIAIVSLADGADALLFRTTTLLEQRRASMAVDAQVANPGIAVPYTTFLEWRGMLDAALPRRPDPLDPCAPSTLRINDWKLRHVGSRCVACGEPHYPPQRVCQNCGAKDKMEAVRPETGMGTVVTSVVDRLAWSPHPPITVAVVDLDGGGRVQIEVTETDGIEIGPGSRVELTFRRAYTTRNGIHNYLWKTRPLQAARTN